MGFYGIVVTAKKQAVDIPQGFSLQLAMACVDWQKKMPNRVTVLMEPGGCGNSPYVLCHLTENNSFSCAVMQEMCEEDGPVSLWCESDYGGGEVVKVHLTGRWAAAAEDEDVDEDEEKTEVLKSSKSAETKKTSDQSSNGKRLRTSSDSVVAATDSTSTTASTQAHSQSQSQSQAQSQAAKKKAKAAEDSELLALAAMMAPPRVDPPSADSEAGQQLKKRKKWKVKPEDDEGVVVPEPKQRTHNSGVLFTDYIVGKGIEPKLGSKIKILYEGSFPDGTVFDSRLKRSKPFVFRKGATEVIRGLDLGIEGMRIGGAREIIVPSALG